MLKLRRSMLYMAAISLVIFVLYKIKPHKTLPWYYYPSPCTYSEEQRRDTIELASKVHSVLSKNSISHVLCYGSLFGALRMEDMLPYDDDLDFCVWSPDLENIEEGYFYQLFKQSDMSLSYDSRHGVYTATYKSATADLVVFENSEDYIWLQRVGALSRILVEEDRERFPSRLIAPPVPVKKFHGIDMPVPRGEIEIQKYLYPLDWWKIMPPPNCDKHKGDTDVEKIPIAR